MESIELMRWQDQEMTEKLIRSDLFNSNEIKKLIIPSVNTFKGTRYPVDENKGFDGIIKSDLTPNDSLKTFYLVGQDNPEETDEVFPPAVGWRAEFVKSADPKPEAIEKDEFTTPRQKSGFEVVTSDVGFDDVGGNQQAKQTLLNIIEQFNDPDTGKKWGVKPPKGVLMYGEPGTGKTMMAKAFAKESGAVFVEIPSGTTNSEWFGKSEEKLRKLFEEAGQHNGRVVLFFDEIDSIIGSRERLGAGDVRSRVTNVFLQSMDGMRSSNNVMVIGSTNQLDKLDSAAIRSGRFDIHIEVELPDAHGCGEILARQILATEREIGRMITEDNLDLARLGRELDGLSGSDIAEILNRVKNTMAKLERLKKSGQLTIGILEPVKPSLADAGIPPQNEQLVITTEDISNCIIQFKTERRFDE